MFGMFCYAKTVSEAFRSLYTVYTSLSKKVWEEVETKGYEPLQERWRDVEGRSTHADFEAKERWPRLSLPRLCFHVFSSLTELLYPEKISRDEPLSKPWSNMPASNEGLSLLRMPAGEFISAFCTNSLDGLQEWHLGIDQTLWNTTTNSQQTMDDEWTCQSSAKDHVMIFQQGLY